jgi:acyl dehydratase
MVDRVEEFLRDSRPLIGQEAADVPEGTDLADYLSIRRFCAALGDTNPLYSNPMYGVTTKYNSMVAPSTFVIAIRTPTSAGAYNRRDYGLVKLLKEVEFEWVDIIRVGDRLGSELSVIDAREGRPLGGRSTAEVVSRARYFNSYGGGIGSSRGTMTAIPFQRGEELLLDRDIYRYSDEEIERIEEGIRNEAPPRGNLLRYWNDAGVGEKLPTLVKPPLSINEMCDWIAAEAKPQPRGSLTYFDLKSNPGRSRLNPTTNWPYMDVEEAYSDIYSSREVGFKTPISAGTQRAALAGQLLTDWMGDDGMLRRLEIDLPGYYQYGDSIWLTAEVVDKYKERVGTEMYHAVDIRLQGANQLAETVVRGSATVYLPNPGQPVMLPIPHHHGRR